jgi:hypothetical protein
MLYYKDLTNHVLLAIGGRPSTAAGQTVAERQAEIINQAGEHLFGYQWTFRQATAMLSTVSALPYVVLPADFSELIAAWCGTLPLLITNQDEIENSRSSDFDSYGTRGYVKAVVPTNAAPTQSYQLQIYPTPESNEANKIKITYRTGWQRVSTANLPTDVISIPLYLETLLVLYVRAITESYEDGQQSQRLAEIEAGTLFGTAQRKDGMLQAHYGQLRPNVWTNNYRNNGGFVMTNTVPNPS